MRHVEIFNTDIDFESVPKLVEALSLHREVDLFINSSGGFSHAYSILQHYLNNREGVVVYPYFYVESCASSLCFLGLNCPVVVSRDLELCMFHVQDRKYYTLRKDYSPNKDYTTKIDKKVNKKELKLLGTYLPKKMLSKYKKGKDVELTYKQLKKYFSKKENIKFI